MIKTACSKGIGVQRLVCTPNIMNFYNLRQLIEFAKEAKKNDISLFPIYVYLDVPYAKKKEFGELVIGYDPQSQYQVLTYLDGDDGGIGGRMLDLPREVCELIDLCSEKREKFVEQINEILNK